MQWLIVWFQRAVMLLLEAYGRILLRQWLRNFVTQRRRLVMWAYTSVLCILIEVLRSRCLFTEDSRPVLRSIRGSQSMFLSTLTFLESLAISFVSLYAFT